MDDQAHVRAELTAVSEELHKCWLDAIKLEAGRDAWHRLGPALDGYHHVPAVLWGWYRDATLAGCRRLVDDRRGTVSVVRALRRLHKVAPSVTSEVILDVWSAERPNLDRDRMAADIRVALSEIVTGDPDQDVARLTARSVHDDLERLRKFHGDLVEFVDRTVAHRVDGEVTAVGEANLSALLDDVLAVARRWVALLDGAELVLESPSYTGFTALIRAAQLFDWPTYVDAVWEHHAQVLGPFAPKEAYDALEDEVEIRYVWPDDE